MKKLYLLLSLFISFQSIAQTYNPIYTAVPFLRITPDARAGGMGETGIATSPDVNSIYWNTAKLPFAQDKFGIDASYTPWLREIVPDNFLFDASSYLKIDSISAITVSFRYLSLGHITFIDQVGSTTLSTLNPYGYAANIGYSRKITKHLSVGINLGYVLSNLARGQINGVPINADRALMGGLSLYYTHPSNNQSVYQGYNLGLTISNLGNKMYYNSGPPFGTKDFLPANLGIGGSVNFKFEKKHKISFGLDLNKLLVPTPDNAGMYKKTYSVLGGAINSLYYAPDGLKEITYSTGVEYIFNDLIMLRAGYYNGTPIINGSQYFTLGGGIRFRVVQIDISYQVPTNGVESPYENSFWFSLSFLFNQHKSAKNKQKS